jgi:hypothetical protein
MALTRRAFRTENTPGRVFSPAVAFGRPEAEFFQPLCSAGQTAGRCDLLAMGRVLDVSSSGSWSGGRIGHVAISLRLLVASANRQFLQ